MKSEGRIITIIRTIIALVLTVSFLTSIVMAVSGPGWTPISGTQYNMVALGDLYVNGTKVNNTNYIVGAFGPGGTSDCRATGNSAANGSYYLTILGDTNGQTISFKVYDTTTGLTLNVTETVSFLSDDTQTLALHALDTTKPEVSSVVLNPVSPVKAGAVTFTITFSKPMNTTVDPVVTFGSTPKTIAKTSYSGTTWVGAYTIAAGYDGTQTISISGAKDISGNTMDANTTHSFVVDTTAPTTTATTPGKTPLNGYYFQADFTVRLTADDAAAVIYYTTDGTTPDTSSAHATATVDIAVNTEGNKTIKFFAVDALGNAETVKTALFVLDKTAPVTSPSVAEGTYGVTQNVTLSVVDANPDKTYYRLYETDPGASPSKPTTAYTSGFNITLTAPADGLTKDYWIVYYSIDKAGNEEAVKVKKYTIDTRAPVTNFTYTSGVNYVSGKLYYNQAIDLTLTSSGNIIYYESGIGTANDPTDASSHATNTLPINFAKVAGADTHYVIKFAAYNPVNQKWGLVQTLHVYVDDVPPALVITAPTSPTNATSQTLTGTTDASGATITAQCGTATIGTVAYPSAGTWSIPITGLAKDSNVINVTATDLAGNTTIKSATILYHPDFSVAPSGNVYVPVTITGYKQAFAITGGSGNFSWVLSTTTYGTLKSTTGTTNEFTPVWDTPGDATLTITDTTYAEKTPIQVSIHAVRFGITPNTAYIILGQTLNLTVVGAQGTVSWTVNTPATATLASATGTANVLTAKAVGTTTLTISDAGITPPVQFTSGVYEVVNAVKVSSAGSVNAVTRGSTLQFSAIGGKGASATDYTWSVLDASNAVVAGAIDANGLFTPPAGTGVVKYTVKAVDKTTTLEGTKEINVVDAIAITGKPAGNAMQSGTSNTFGFTGGSGTVKWTATAGSIDNAGKFTAPTVIASTPVTITATDATYSNVTTTYQLTVYGTVAVTNKPTTPPTVKPGESSTAFTVSGGSGAYTWTVAGPVAVAGGTAASYTFVAPSDPATSFAGKYTITVKDTANAGFTDTFDVYVPLKVIAWNTTSGAQINPVMYTGGTTYALKALGVAAGTNLVLTKEESSVTAAVLQLPASPTTTNPFGVTPNSEGSSIVTIKTDAADADNFKGSIRVDVLGVSTLGGTIGNIPANLDKSKITVQLLGGGKNILDATYGTTTISGLAADGKYAFKGAGDAGLPWQSYWVKVMVGDTANYVYYETSANVLVNTATATQNFTLPALTPIIKSYGLTVNASVALAAGDQYTIINSATGQIVRTNNAVVGASFTEQLEQGAYRLIILKTGYTPFEYNNLADGGADSNVIALTANKTVTATLVANAAFKPNAPTVDASQENGTGGFALKAVKNNFTGAFAVSVGASGPLAYTGSGTAADPYVYNWTTTGPNTGTAPNTPGTGDTTYTVKFDFKDGATAAGSYTATFVQYASTTNETAGKTQDQKDLESQQGTGTLFVVLGDKEFFPLVGTSFNVTLKDATGASRLVPIDIPPIPLEYLYVDDFDQVGAGADNLKYTAATDVYNVVKPLGKTVAAGDVLQVKVDNYTLGGNSLSTGVNISFVRPSDGATIRYNPYTGAGRIGRVTTAPVITLPLLLNPQSATFKALKKLSDAKGSLQVMVSERGDGAIGFRAEPTTFVIQDDGLVWLSVRHLSGWTLGSGSSSSSGGGVFGSSGCFIATAAYGSALEGHVQILRDFRDAYLMPSTIGRAFVEFYYRNSPPLADFIAKHDGIRAAVRIGLAPVVGASYVALHTTTGEKVLILMLLTGLLVGGFVGIRRFGLRKSM